jgi:ABC-2 type transport system permease protein
LEAWYEVLRAFREPAFAIPSLAFPVVFYGLFAVVLPGTASKATYMFATYAVFGAIGPALFGFGVGMAMERAQGWLDLKRVAPMPTGAYFFAKIFMSLLFASVIYLLLSIVAIGFGGVKISFASWLLLLLVLLVGVLPFVALGLWLGSFLRGQAAVAVVNLVYLPMAVLSGLWIPLFVFPKLLQSAAVVWPAYHFAELALATVVAGRDLNWPLNVGYLLLCTVLFLALAANNLRKA